jgi:hypothetical protein
MDDCDHAECDADAVRHFMMHHFCPSHNREIRQAAQEECPDDLLGFVESYTTRTADNA